jgi:pilus assembly protein FimV
VLRPVDRESTPVESEPTLLLVVLRPVESESALVESEPT